MALSSKGVKVLASLVLILAVLLISAGVIVYLLTRPVEIEFAQDPNPLEAHEASRKIKLLGDAREAKRLGFVRLSEVEINSFLDARFNDPKRAQTNLPMRLVKTGVLLHQTNLTFITWMKAPALGMEFPLVWQRTVSPTRQGDQWTFTITAMQLGKMNVPEAMWPRVNELLGKADTVFEERKTWLASVPKIALMKNELSLAPELRLYSYQPPEKGGL